MTSDKNGNNLVKGGQRKRGYNRLKMRALKTGNAL